MCLSYCHRLGETLFWNHLDCHPLDCEFAGGRFPVQWRCSTCRHRDTTSVGSEICGLTRAALPDRGGCCHYNVVPATGQVVVAQLVGRPWRTNLPDLLDWLGVPYEVLPDGKVRLDLGDLSHSIPATYGIGTEPEEEEEVLGQVPLSAEDRTRAGVDFDLASIFP